MAKLLVSWKNYSSCADCAYHLKRDLYTSFGYIIMGISIYKYVAPYTTIWWVLAIGYLYALADHMYMLCYPRSPPLPVFLTIYWIAISEGPTQAGAMFYKWKKMNDNDREFHTHGNSLVEIAQHIQKSWLCTKHMGTRQRSVRNINKCICS